MTTFNTDFIFNKHQRCGHSHHTFDFIFDVRKRKSQSYQHIIIIIIMIIIIIIIIIMVIIIPLVQTLTTRDCKGPQTKMPKNVEPIKT